MTIDDVLVGDTTIRVLTTDGDEYEFDRDDDEATYCGSDVPPQAVLDAVAERGFTPTNIEWPRRVSVYISDEPSGRRAAAEVFPDKGDEYEIASGMGTHLDLTYEVDRTGEATLVRAQHPSKEVLVRRNDGPPAPAFDTIWATYTREQFNKDVQLYLPDELGPAEYEDVGYMPKARRSDNEPFNWSAFYDFYCWLVENGYAVIPIEDE